MRHLGLWTLPLAAALLAGCGPSAAPAATAETAAPAAWHWEAQTVDLQGASSVGDIICKVDGTVQLCLYDKSNDEYRMLVSADNGETWTSQFPDWLPGVQLRAVQLRAIDPDTGTNTQLLEDVPGGAVAAMTGLPDGTLYFLNGTGIWRLAAGGTLPELVVEIPGKDLTASSPENRVSACLGCAADGSFLVLTHDAYGASTLTRYAMVSE